MFAKPERAKGSARIDGISATVNALGRAMVVGSGITFTDLRYVTT
jgi:hypothetical protein